MLLRACTTSVSWLTGFVILTETDRAIKPVTQEIATNTTAMIALATATTLGTSDSSLEKALQHGQEAGGKIRARSGGGVIKALQHVREAGASDLHVP